MYQSVQFVLNVTGFMNEPIEWTNERRKLSELIPWEPNPRQTREPQAVRIVKSLDDFGYSQLIEIEPDNTIIDGHQRSPIMAMMDKYGPDAEVDVRVSSRKLTTQERKKYIIYKHEGATGEWDFDALANLYDVEELGEWGMPEWKLPTVPDGESWGDAFAGLPDEDRAHFQRMAFSLHDTQVEVVREALALAKGQGPFDSENENSNGNALARVCELFVGDYGQG